jgi:hypothetical protein
MRRPLIASLTIALVLGAGTASAQADTVTFGVTGAEQMFVVPPGVTTVNVRAVGAHGGRGSQESPGMLGGAGAIATADLAVKPGQVLFIEVGGRGADGNEGFASTLGGFNGGGDGARAAAMGGSAGGGGGATDVRTLSRSIKGSLDSRVIVAGGGGGSGGQSDIPAGDAGAGGAAGQDGQDGQDFGGLGGNLGKGAGPAAGGAGGAGGGSAPDGGKSGTAGVVGVGGNGGKGGLKGSEGGAGGGGGGGLFGGGGGGGGEVSAGSAPGAGGGGGSSGFGSGTSNSSIAAAAFSDPSVVIVRYTAPPETKLTDTPKARLKAKRRAKAEFGFSSTTKGASFQCSIDDGAFASCTSPATFRVGKGKHSFAVRAVSGGVSDPTPATFDFKVKKRKSH